MVITIGQQLIERFKNTLEFELESIRRDKIVKKSKFPSGVSIKHFMVAVRIRATHFDNPRVEGKVP